MMENEESRPWSREKISDSLLENSRALRKQSTPAEELLWSKLRNRKLNNLKFRRQQPMEGFILDFYCDQAKLGIELDGGIHLLRELAEYDEQRTAFLNEFGIEIIRFSNNSVMENIHEVLKEIRDVVSKRLAAVPSPRPRSSDTPLPGERGE